ncbi:MAG TPA: adenylate/guanylate cyclase domain-containing protein [Saprospiraceae bacterium]|nr:adenylate/guanylate cyclase domain-containing protein [Saprospiraceae bacterium]
MEKVEAQNTPSEKRLLERLERRNREMRILKSIASKINASFDLNFTLHTLLQHLDEFFGFKHSMVLLTSAGDPFLTVYASHGYTEGGTGAKVRIGKGVVGIVAQHRKMLNVPNITTRLTYLNPVTSNLDSVEHEITLRLPGLRNPKSQAAFPLLVQNELVGVLAVESEEPRIYDSNDEEIMCMIAEQAAMAIHKTRLYEAEHTRNKEILEMNETLSSLYLQQQETLNLFMKYVPEPVVKKSLRTKSESMFDGELLNIAVLFCDIRDFTHTSETLSPNQVVTLLNVYYRHMSIVIGRYEGVINQFVGDEIFVTFGAPIGIINCEEKAVRCALGMMEQLQIMNEELLACLKVQIKIGIGINYGPVIAGNLGTVDRIEYSVTGDTVNTGKRIETLTKERPDTVLVSESIHEKVKDLFSFTPWEPVEVKGKGEKVAVYEVERLMGL